MALRQVILGKKIGDLNKELAAEETKEAELRERRAEMERREAELTEAVEEVTEETSPEDKEALDGELAKYEEDDKALAAEEEEHETKRQAIKAQIAELEKELEEINERSASTGKKAEDRKERKAERPMENRKFFGMDVQERDAFFAREDVKGFLRTLREMGREKRSITGGDLTIPDVMLGIIRQQTAE
ncbi:MAG: hypothetical protein UD575_06540, partial [Oscillospiraceae bacterium]|nr:hypothetical protein [Oscillospiraceae bacterium]